MNCIALKMYLATGGKNLSGIGERFCLFWLSWYGFLVVGCCLSFLSSLIFKM